MANGSQVSLHYVAESTYGTTPGTPALTAIRYNSNTLNLGKEVISSEEIRSDRMTTDTRHGPKSVAGDIVTELSYGSHDDLLAAALAGTWVSEEPASGTDQLKAGTTRTSLTVRKYFEDLTTGNAYHVLTGCEVNSLNLSITPGAIVGSTYSLMGQGLATQASEISGAVVGTASTTEALTAISGAINEGGVAIATVTELSLTIENGMETRFVVGSDETLQPSIGRSKVSGSVTAYYEDQALLDKFIDETNSSLDVTLLDTAGNQIKIDIPNIVFTSGAPDVGGEGPITLSMSFDAVYDSTNDTNLLIERTPA